MSKRSFWNFKKTTNFSFLRYVLTIQHSLGCMMFLFFSTLSFANDFMIAQQSIVHTELDNGLDMIWIDDGQSTIDLYTVYAAGTYMENKSSLAHMTEHAMFCTKDGAFDTILKPYVQSTNAYTRNEHTTYYSMAIALENFPLVVEREFRRMNTLELDQTCFDYEKGRLEKEESQDTSVLNDITHKKHELLFGTQYAGTATEQEDISLADVQQFYAQW